VAGLYLLFCKTVSGAASLLGTLETTVSGILAGTISAGALGGLLGTLNSFAEELADEAEEAEEDESSASKRMSTSQMSSSSASCVIATVSNCEVFCRSNIVDGTQATRTCFSTSCTASKYCPTQTSASALVSTTFNLGYCPLHLPTPGPVSLFSYSGFIPRTVGADDDDEATTSTMVTSVLPSTRRTLISSVRSTPISSVRPTPTPSTGPTPIPCTKPAFCELNGCKATVVNGNATCKGTFSGCACIPSAKTPGFQCGNPQSCEANSCRGRFVNGKATCTNAFAGCECVPSTKTPALLVAPRNPANQIAVPALPATVKQRAKRDLLAVTAYRQSILRVSFVARTVLQI